MARRLSPSLPEVQMNMTPLIDIVFNLLLFFVLSTNYVQQTSFELDLPGAASASPSSKGIIVTLTRDERILVDSEEVPLEALEATLRGRLPASDTPPPLLVLADRLVYHDRVVKLLDVAQMVGFRDLEIAAIQEEPRPAGR